MFISFLKDAGAESQSIGTTAFFSKDDMLQLPELKAATGAVDFTLNPTDEDSEFIEVSGDISIEGISIGQYSITYDFFDDYLSPNILDTVGSQKPELREKISCQNIESLLVLEWSITPDLVDKIESIIDSLLESHIGILFVDEVGLFDRSGFLLQLSDSLYE